MKYDNLVEKYKLNDLENIISEIENTICKEIEEKDIQEAMDNINFLLYTIGKSIVTLREIIILCREGFPDGALALARNLFEQFVHVLYIEQREGSESFDSLLEKYYVNYNVQRTKALMFAAVNIDNSFEQSRLCQDELNEIRKKYGVKNLID